MLKLPRRAPLAGALALALSLPNAVGAAAAREGMAADDATGAATGAAGGPVGAGMADTGTGGSELLATGPELALAARLDRVEVHGAGGPYPSSPRMPAPLLDTPKSVTIVPAELLEEQGVTTLRDALRNVPGISLQAGEGGVPAGDNLTLRGFSARTDLFIDGVRDFGGYTRDPFNIAQIEVVKGPGSAHAGRGSTGGSINLASKQPADEAFGHASLSAGSADLLRATADFNQPIKEGIALRVNAMAHESGIDGRDAVENQRWGLAPSLALALGDTTTATLSLFHLQQDNVPDYGQPWVPATNNALPESRNARAPVAREAWYGLLDRDYEDTATDLATLSFDVANGAAWTLRNLTRWGRSTRDSIITAPRFLGNDGTDIRRTAKTRDSEDRILANVTDLVVELEAGGMHHTLVTGLEVAREESQNLARTATDGTLADLFDPDPSAPYTGTISRSPQSDAFADADSVSAYLFDTVALDERWVLSGGLRWDRFEVETESFDSDSGSRVALSRSDSMLSGRASVLFKPGTDSSVYLGYGTSFNPSAEGLSLNPQTALLDPEESRTLELGARRNVLDGRLLLGAAVFRTEKTNARTEDADEVIVLEGEQRVDGLELTAAGRLGADWTVFAGYAFLDSEVVRSLDPAEQGNALGNTPEHSASLWTTVDIGPRLQLGFGAQHVGARFSNASNIREAKAYTVFDAMASVRLGDSTLLRFNVDNVFDKDYIDSVGGGHYVPGAGRSLMASLDLAF